MDFCTSIGQSPAFLQVFLQFCINFEVIRTYANQFRSAQYAVFRGIPETPKIDVFQEDVEFPDNPEFPENAESPENIEILPHPKILINYVFSL